MKVTHYIIYTTSGRLGEMGNVVARNKSEAIQFAITHFRTSKKLKSNVHVRTHVLFESKDKTESEEFYNRLMARVAEADGEAT